jgi:hypothetical protein
MEDLDLAKLIISALYRPRVDRTDGRKDRRFYTAGASTRTNTSLNIRYFHHFPDRTEYNLSVSFQLLWYSDKYVRGTESFRNCL